jgi:hypothetical protein
MSTELYGVDAQIVSSIGPTPVSTETNLIFIGASASGDLNKPYLITSMSDYASKLGGAAGDGYNLTEAAIAAFQIAGISKVYMIPVSHSLSFTASDYTGDASLFTGVYAIEALLRDNPTAVNILCAPSITDATVLAALDGVAKKAAGHWQSFMMYDLPESDDQLNSAGVAQVDEIVEDKQLADAHALAVWGHVKTTGGYFVSGAAVRACLQAKSDADYDAPARSGGNLQIPAIVGIGRPEASEDYRADGFMIMHGQGFTEKLKFGTDEHGAYIYMDYDENANYVLEEVLSAPDFTDCSITELDGKVALTGTCTNASGGCSGVKFSIVHPEKKIVLPESEATQLSADGVCSYNYYGNGVYHTWGDHPSIFAGGTVSDQANRFDNNIRMLMMITNSFQLAHRFEVDQPMTLAMRNDIITYEQFKLNQLKSRGAIIGNPVVEFRPDENSTDDLQQGRFVWSFEVTPTIPAKYLKAEVAYSSAGLSVYTQAE